MFCKQCGRHIPEGETLCPECGYNTVTGTIEKVQPGFTQEEPIIPSYNEVPVEKGPVDEIPAERPAENISNPALQAGSASAYQAAPQVDPASAYQAAPQVDPASAPQASPYSATAPEKKLRGGGFSITGLVLAVLNVLFFWFPFLPLLNGILGIIFSALGIRSTQKTMGIVALIINIVFLIIAILISFFYIYVIYLAIENPNLVNNYYQYFNYLQ